MPKKKSKKKAPSELYQRFIDALGMSADPNSEQIKQLISQMTVTEKVREAIRSKMLERYPIVKKNIGNLIAKSFDFTEEELLKLTEFLESDLGKKFRTNHPIFNEQLSKLLDEEAITVMNSVVGLIQEEMTKKAVDKGCDYKYYLLPVKDWCGRKMQS
jgi:hypothetical protein